MFEVRAVYVCATFYFLALNLSRIFDRVKKDSIIEEKNLLHFQKSWFPRINICSWKFHIFRNNRRALKTNSSTKSFLPTLIPTISRIRNEHDILARDVFLEKKNKKETRKREKGEEKYKG